MNLLEKIKDAGVVGAGGAGFPTYVKLDTEAEYVLLNAAECEPLLRVDEELIKVHADKIINGLKHVISIVNAKKGIIGIKGKHTGEINILKEEIRRTGSENIIEVGILPDIYPAGDEQILVYELTGRIVPETSIPIAVGCVVINVETTYNVSEAIDGSSVTEKYVTVCGAVPKPVTLRVAIGTPIKEVIAMSGLDDLSDYDVIDGGPMMGGLLKDHEGYISKKTKGYVVLPKEHGLIRKKKREMNKAIHLNRSACEQCRLCTDLCPRHLLGHSTSPHKIVRSLAYGVEADESLTAALTCCQCNLCEYFSCPAGISPKMANLYYMGELRSKEIKHTPKEEFKVNPMREYRLVKSKRLILRLGLKKYDVEAPLNDELYLPEYVGISLNTHVGAPAEPVVKAGESVRKGQLIGKIQEQKLGATVHSSIDGIVETVDDNLIIIRSK